MTQICVVPVYLFTGVLMERIKAQLARLQAHYPQIAFGQGTHFGFDPAMFDLLDARVAATGPEEGGLLECDGCKYRDAAEAEHLHEHHHDHGHDHGHDHHHDHSDHQHVHA